MIYDKPKQNSPVPAPAPAAPVPAVGKAEEEVEMDEAALPLTKFHDWYKQEVRAKIEQERKERRDREREADPAVAEQVGETKGANTGVGAVSP